MKNLNSNLVIPTNKSGYFNCWDMVQKNLDDFNIFIIIGGRRLGKTYSILKGLIKDKKNHMYVRRTDSDLQECLTAKKNPYRAFKDIADVRLVAKGRETNICTFNEDDEIIDYLGIASSVSTSGSVRGAYLEDIEYLVYDEFINLKPTNTLKRKEGNLFLDLYDTANNDRDLRGMKPLKAILLSNANTVDDGLLRVLKLGHVIYDMVTNNKNYYADYERKIYVALLPNDNEVTKKREQGAIGKLTNETSYGKMAMENKFVDSYFGDIDDNIKYIEYYGLCSYNNIYFYIHKNDGHVLASSKKTNVRSFTSKTVKQFYREYGMKIGMQYENGMMRFENYDIKLDVINLL